ncbi:hypothetical protein JMJ77_0006144, partial [Colletotrichum scovillei]
FDSAQTTSRSNSPSVLRPYGGEIRFSTHFQLPMIKIAQSRRQCQRHQPKAKHQHSVKVLEPATP